MKRFIYGVLVILLFFPAFAQVPNASFRQPPTDLGRMKEYLPGDFVHIIVDAPLDTAKILSTMPDGTEVPLVRDRRANVWHGLWQVPIQFKKGNYAARLQATDIEGNTFTGETNPFLIGEIAIVTLVEKPKGGVTGGEVREKVKEEKEVREEVAEERAVTTTTIRPVIRPKREMSVTQVEKKKDLNAQKTKLIAGTRYYLEKMDYVNARAQLQALVKADPGNAEARKMLVRMEVLVKTKGGR